MDKLTFDEYMLKQRSTYPHLRRKINEFEVLCRDEIEEGGSPENERELCVSSVDYLISKQELWL